MHDDYDSETGFRNAVRTHPQFFVDFFACVCRRQETVPFGSVESMFENAVRTHPQFFADFLRVCLPLTGVRSQYFWRTVFGVKGSVFSVTRLTPLAET